LDAASRGRFKLRVAGAFTGVAETVTATDGQACACANPEARLCGMQVVLEAVG
jgi:hypothetical protein